jgi:hypothetical protein
MWTLLLDPKISTVTRGGWYQFDSSKAGNIIGHNGQLEGGIALAFYRTDGIGMVVTFNGERRPSKADSGPISLYRSDAVDLAQFADAVTSWPVKDQFPNADASWK